MKRVMMAMFGMMAIGAASTPALATTADLPKWEASVENFTNTLRKGMNLVELSGTGGSVVIEKRAGTLYAWATSGEERRALPDGSYPFSRPGITACDVEYGIVTACR